MERTEYDEPTEDPVQCLLPQHVKRALVYMRANLAEKIALPGLAATCAAPERTLLKQFKRFVGISPLAYLRRLRLNVARSQSLQADCETAISEIAMSCGFIHLGRFATEYRRAFGESPSATRQRVRGEGLDGALLPAPVVWREKPALLVVPFRTETLQEELETRDLMERLSATLSHMRIASVTRVHPSRALSFSARRQRDGGTQYGLMGRVRRVDHCTRVIARLIDVEPTDICGATVSMVPRMIRSHYRIASSMVYCAGSWRASPTQNSDACSTRIPGIGRHAIWRRRHCRSFWPPGCRVR
jgi:AraC-like DNA-binding protein/TolB-like protein